MKKIISLFLCLCMPVPLLAGCELTVSLKEGVEGKTDGGSDLDISKAPDRDIILRLAEKYYNDTYVFIEDGFGLAFMRLVPKKPDFTGKTSDEDFVLETSLEVASSIFVYEAKNYNIAVSAAMLAKAPDSVSAATNFAAAVAAYHDAQDFFGQAAFTETTNNQYYNDAVTIYKYAVAISMTDGKPTQASLTPLTSLGNLLIDMGMSEKALPFFGAALETDPDYTPAFTGKQKALFVLMRWDELELEFAGFKKKSQPVQEEQRNLIHEWLQEIYQMPAETIVKTSGKLSDEIAEVIKQDAEVEVISKADALTLLSAEAEAEIRRRLKETQSNVKLEAPDLSIIFDYTDWQEFFTVFPYLPDIADLMGGEKLWEVKEKIDKKVWEYYEKSESLREQLEKEYPQRGLEFVGPGIDAGTGMAMFSAMYDRKMAPFAMNPFDYCNPEDVFIQQGLISGYLRKQQTIINYTIAFMDELEKEYQKVNDSIVPENERLEKEYWQKWDGIYEKYDKLKPLDERESNAMRSELHQLALDYYSRFKSLYENSWQIAMGRARELYGKFSETFPVMYNDIMKYVMLISDPEVRDALESEANSRLIAFMSDVCFKIGEFRYIGYVREFDEYGYADITGYQDIIKGEELQKIDAVELEAAMERYEKAMKGKAAFEAGILDENSAYYKERIEKYEAKYNFGFIKYTVNDYKDTTTMGFNLGIIGADISQTEYHYSGNVKMDGNLEVGAGMGLGDNASIGVAAKFGWTAGLDANGNIIPNSVDIRAGLEGGVNAFKVLDVKGGIEASVMRGTKAYGDIGLTGNEIFKDLRTKAWEKRLGREMTDIEKDVGIFAMYHNNYKLPEPPKLWSGEYVITPPAGTIKLQDKK